MTSNASSFAAHRHGRGFSLIAALFLIIAVMLAAVAMVATSTSRSSSTVLGLDASRALFAARSGIDIATAQVLSGGCAAVPASLSLEGFSVDLGCSALADDEAGVAFSTYQLQARAYRGSLAGNTFVARRVRAVVSDAP